jgi:hypothetical protein
MIRKLYLDPTSPKGSFTLPGTYRDKTTRTQVYLVDEGRRVVTESEVDYYQEHNISVTNGQPFLFEYDDEKTSDLAVVDFIKNHPLCVTEGHKNPNFAVAIFKVRLQHEKVEIETGNLEKNLVIALKVLSMSFEDKYNLAFALGLNPKGMTHSELVVSLLGPNLTGAAVAQKETFDIFYNSFESNKKAMVYANTAVSLGIIKYENGYFVVGGRTIGTTNRDVIDLCLSDKEFFNGFVVPEVDKSDDFVAEGRDDFEVKEQIITKEIEVKAEEIAPNPSMIPVADKKPTTRSRKS